MAGVRVHLARFRAPIVGYLQVAATSHGLVRIRLGDEGDGILAEVERLYPGALVKRGGGLTSDAARVLRRYLSGGPDPRLPVVLPEEGFSVRVWREIARIPRGEVRSYARVARAVRRPQAFRAVGQACGRNPLPLVIPCHRVVTSDRTLGGFGAGLDLKRRLLALEGVALA